MEAVNNMGHENKPAITIGMPVYNGADSIKIVLDSLLNQTFRNFELIISDNASTDDTEKICRSYAAENDQIKYIRQKKNIVAIANFKYVLSEACGDYFIWAAADDIRSADYLQLNYDFLQDNPNYVASGTPNGFDNWPSSKELVKFSIEEDEVFKRHLKFFNNCFQSHGLFYCLFRTKILTDSDIFDDIFTNSDWLGFDWATILHLLTIGKINRTLKGSMTFGVRGESSKNIFRIHSHTKIEKFIPFYVLSKLVMKITRDFTTWQKIRILYILVKLNCFAFLEPIYRVQKNFLYKIYCKYLKSKIKSL